MRHLPLINELIADYFWICTVWCGRKVDWEHCVAFPPLLSCKVDVFVLFSVASVFSSRLRLTKLFYFVAPGP